MERPRPPTTSRRCDQPPQPCREPARAARLAAALAEPSFPTKCRLGSPTTSDSLASHACATRRLQLGMLARMRVAVLADIHGNLPALDAVLAEVEATAVDLIVIGGDVAAGPMPGPTLERLALLGDRAQYVMGNGDREMVEAYDGPGRAPLDWAVTQWAAEQLDRASRDVLASSPRPHRDFCSHEHRGVTAARTAHQDCSASRPQASGRSSPQGPATVRAMAVP